MVNDLYKCLLGCRIPIQPRIVVRVPLGIKEDTHFIPILAGIAVYVVTAVAIVVM